MFPHTTAQVYHTLFAKSLHLLSHTLQRDIYRLSHPGSSLKDVRRPSPDPLVAAEYSCVYWVDHLFDTYGSNKPICTEDLQDKGVVHDFLCNKYLNWLEELSLVQDMSQGVLAMDKLSTLFQARLRVST